MQILSIYLKNKGIVDFIIKDTKKELTVGDAIRIKKIHDKIVEKENKALDLASQIEHEEVDEFEGKIEMEELDIVLNELYIQLLQVFIKDPEQKKLVTPEHFPYQTREDLEYIIKLTDQIEIDWDKKPEAKIDFYFKPGAEVEIKEAYKDLEELDDEVQKKEIKLLKNRIKKMKEGHFFVLPAGKIMLQARVANDQLQKQLNQVGNSDKIKQELKKYDYNISEYIKDKINPENATTIQEVKELNKRTKDLHSYIAKYKMKQYEILPHLISHNVILDGSEYTNQAANLRAKSFENLDLETAENVGVFFLAVHLISTQNTPGFLKDQGLLTQNLVNAIKENTDGTQ